MRRAANADRRGVGWAEERSRARFGGDQGDDRSDSWCTAVNNHGGFGRWGYIEVTSMPSMQDRLNEAIASLYGDGPIIGDPDLLDYNEVH